MLPLSFEHQQNMSVAGRRIVFTPNAPKPVGPYSQAVIVGDTMYLAGQIGLDPITGILVPGGTIPETEQALKNMGAVLDAAGASYRNVVKVTILLANIADFEDMNNVYMKYFLSQYPARSTFQVAALPKDAKVEIEAVAVVGNIADLN